MDTFALIKFCYSNAQIFVILLLNCRNRDQVSS